MKSLIVLVIDTFESGRAFGKLNSILGVGGNALPRGAVGLRSRAIGVARSENMNRAKGMNVG